MTKKLTKAALGRALSPAISGTMVGKLEKRGMPVHSVEAATRWRRENLDPSLTKQSREPQIRELLDAADAAGRLPDFTTSRAKREFHNALIAEYEQKKLCGELAPVADFDDTLGRLAFIVREKLLGLPNKLTPMLLGLDDPAEIYSLLEAEIFEALAELCGQAGAVATTEKG